MTFSSKDIDAASRMEWVRLGHILMVTSYLVFSRLCDLEIFGTVSVDRSRTKVAHRVEGGKVIGAPRKGLEWGSCGRARIVGDEGRSRKPRVTLERKITWSTTAEGTGAL